ncbi:MAG: TolC family protein [Bacteroidia bacterium]
MKVIMMNKRVRSSILGLFTALCSVAQVPDTFLFNELAFLRQARDYAPTVLSSNLEVDIQNQEFLAAKGAFEPKLAGKYNLKNFDNKTYYNKLNTGLKLKTPLGIKVDGGFTDNSGVFLNPEANVPVQGLAYAGIEVPLGAGLFTDEERTHIKQQRLETDAAALLNTLTVNDYLLEAGESYWDWYGSILLLQVSQEAVALASNRLNFVKRKNIIGESADIDTLEAFINYQNRQTLNLSAIVKWEKNKNYVRNYIWLPTRNADDLKPEVDMKYEAVFPDSLLGQQYIKSHPMIKLLETDSLVNRAGIALAREYFKPQVDLAFKLQENASDFGQFDYSPAENNYVGVNVYMPLLLRKQRAKAKQLQYKEQIISNKKSEVSVRLQNAQRTYYRNSLDLKRSVNVWSTATVNYRRMLQAEQTKFNLGESSLFVLNSRELKWIDAREKYIKSYIMYRKSILRYYHSLGILSAVLAQ